VGPPTTAEPANPLVSFPRMSELLAGTLSALVRLQNDVAALVLAASVGLCVSALLQGLLGHRMLPPRARHLGEPTWRRGLRAGGHLGFGVVVAGFGGLYAVFVLSRITWQASTLLVAAVTLVAFVGFLLAQRLVGRIGPRGVTGGLLKAVLLLSLLVLALVTLMTAGFLALTEDRPVLLVELTGATGTEEVRWAPPGGDMRTAPLRTHEVLFRRPSDGAVVGQAWVYGDQIAVKGQVLRLSPLLNAAGITNLFELTFAHNGYRTLERHNTMPQKAYPLSPVGPLAVHPMWRKTRERLLAMWERGTEDGSAWVVRSSTTESTFFPLVDVEGRPLRRTYRLVLTPGGLSAS
jgi:hypothetical protein